MLARRHIAASGIVDPRFIVIPFGPVVTESEVAFADVGEDGTMLFSSIEDNIFASGASGVEAVAIHEGGDARYYVTSVNSSSGVQRLSYVLLDRADVIDEDDYDTSIARLIVNREFGTRSYTAFSNIIRSFRFDLSPLRTLSPLNFTHSTDVRYLDIDYAREKMYALGFSSIEIFDISPVSGAPVALGATSFSTSTELTSSNTLCQYDGANDVLYVLDQSGDVAAYDMSDGNVGTALGTISLTWGPTTGSLSDLGVMRVDPANNALLISEGDAGDAIHVINISNPSSMTAEKIAGGAAMTGGAMVGKPCHIYIKYGYIFIGTSEYNDGEGNRDVVISIDGSSILTSTSTVSGNIDSNDLSLSGTRKIGAFAVF